MRCPDCSAVSGKKRGLDHDQTCPLGLALDVVADADADWFTAHPHAGEYHRAITPAEVQEYGMFGIHGIRAMTRVHVTQVEPGRRTRRPYNGAGSLGWNVLDVDGARCV